MSHYPHLLGKRHVHAQTPEGPCTCRVIPPSIIGLAHVTYSCKGQCVSPVCASFKQKLSQLCDCIARCSAVYDTPIPENSYSFPVPLHPGLRDAASSAEPAGPGRALVDPQLSCNLDKKELFLEMPRRFANEGAFTATKSIHL